MLNLALFTPRNILVIGVFSVLALALASNLFRSVDTTPDSEN